ncbi:uncharacterized protein RJT20DRAFT_128834 [Scheffersomyces xylosifermentans]|uniref:uncharacterized protein n=1 Tax=Scheffersomyces xylosifermentans TaxID=1304137 RepID=UPI00315CBC5E
MGLLTRFRSDHNKTPSASSLKKNKQQPPAAPRSHKHSHTLSSSFSGSEFSSTTSESSYTSTESHYIHNNKANLGHRLKNSPLQSIIAEEPAAGMPAATYPKSKGSIPPGLRPKDDQFAFPNDGSSKSPNNNRLRPKSEYMESFSRTPVKANASKSVPTTPQQPRSDDRRKSMFSAPNQNGSNGNGLNAQMSSPTGTSNPLTPVKSPYARNNNFSPSSAAALQRSNDASPSNTKRKPPPQPEMFLRAAQQMPPVEVTDGSTAFQEDYDATNNDTTLELHQPPATSRNINVNTNTEGFILPSEAMLASASSEYSSGSYRKDSQYPSEQPSANGSNQSSQLQFFNGEYSQQQQELQQQQQQAMESKEPSHLSHLSPKHVSNDVESDGSGSVSSDFDSEEDSEAKDEQNGSEQEESELDDSFSTISTANNSSRQPQQHPQYEQWRQYYASIAAMQQQQQQNQQQQHHQVASNRASVYGAAQQQFHSGITGSNTSFHGNNNLNNMSNNMNNNTMPSMTGLNPMQTMQMQHYMSQQQGQQHAQSPVHAGFPYNQHQLQQSYPEMAHPQQRSLSSGYLPKSQSAQSLRTTPSPTRPFADSGDIASPGQRDYLSSYKKIRNSEAEILKEDGSELLSNSRRSTIKSNRFPSVPSLTSRRASRTNVLSSIPRNASVDLNFKPKEFHAYTEEEDEEKAPASVANASGGSSASPSMPQTAGKSISYGLNDLVLEDKEKEVKRQISDYSKYLFDDDDDDDEDEQEIQKITKPTLSKVVEEKNRQLPTPTSTVESLSRHESNASSASYNSIQSGGSNKFKVGSALDRKERLNDIKTKSSSDEKLGKKEKNVKKMAMEVKTKKNGSPPVSLHHDTHHIPSASDFISAPLTSLDPGTRPPFVNPVLNQSTEYTGTSNSSPSIHHAMPPASKRNTMLFDSPASNRNSMIIPGSMNFDSHRHSMPMVNMMNQPGMRASMMPQFQSQHLFPQQPAFRINDSTINQKMEDFVKLRSVIAAGNKTLEYRLKWVKMLISSTNYKLYAYVNIKGEPIAPEQVTYNKSLFVKSSVTHLLKLLKEYESGKGKDEDVEEEVYYIYGCLLKQDYSTLYNQDFGIAKDVQRAIYYFEKCLEMNPHNGKASFKLADIYEYEFADEFEKALGFYRESAKVGYNRAIYKVALLYLNVPAIRSTKYFRYLKDLSTIESQDVGLVDEDRDELTEVVGLASYQLGKIYEGIYPGDLSTDDEFVQKSLQLAPVNYAKSLTYYNKSAKLNCLLAQVKLGNVYENGELNREKNPSKSIQWYLKASTSPLSFRRHPDAMLGMARWSLNGSNGLSKHIPFPNPERALMWADRAIKEFNSPDAMFMMGELAEMGIANSNPHSWFVRAYEMGHRGAGRKLGYEPPVRDILAEGIDDDIDNEFPEDSPVEDETDDHEHQLSSPPL